VAHQQIKTIPITQQVPVYVTRETDDRFPLPCGFVRLHNAYAGNTSPQPFPSPPVQLTPTNAPLQLLPLSPSSAPITGSPSAGKPTSKPG
jgi:hypothetical protein